MHRQVIIEGSSSAKNYHDELGKHGFTGRIDDRLRKDCQDIKRRNNWRTVPSWTYVNNYAMPGRLLPTWATRFGTHLDDSLARPEFHKDGVRTLGIFVLEGHPLFLLSKFGHGDRSGEALKDTWRHALDIVQGECLEREVRPIFVQMPPPLRQMGQLGPQIHQDLVEITEKAAYSLDNAPVVHVPEMLHGHDVEPFLADDRMHPSGPGHELIYRHLLPLVYDALELEPSEPFPDPSPEAVLHDLSLPLAHLAIRHA